MLSMLRGVVGIDKYIVQVYGVEVVKVVLQGIINIALKSAWTVIYPKGYNSVFKLTKA